MKNWKDNKNVHDQIWGKVRDFAKSRIDLGEDVNTSWYNTNIYEMSNSSMGKNLNSIPYTINGKLRYANAESYLQTKLSVLTETLMQYMTSDLDLIIDMGSGWGRNSIYMSNYFGKSIDFLACELSDSGRECTEYFKTAYDLPITTLPFNYYDNTTLLDFLRTQEPLLSNVLIFSNYSIEQITNIGKTFFESLVSLEIPVITCVHLEPVTWQLLGTQKNTSPHYNEDLVETLRALDSEGILSLKEEIPNFYGHRKEFAASLLVWEKNNR